MAKSTNEVAQNGTPDTGAWVDEQVGFAPYWNPEEGKSFIGRVVDKDSRDPDFLRYTMQAGQDLTCYRGPVDNQETVEIKSGEVFSISVYYSLAPVFDFYLESGIKPLMKVTALKEVKTKTTGQSVWTWRLQVSPQDKKLIEATREKYRALKERSDAEEFPPKEMRS